MSEEADRKELGARLKRAREYLELSQDDVARHLGKPRAAISLMESGQRKVEALELKKLASLYQTSVADLSGETMPKEQTPKLELLKRATAELSLQDQDELLTFARFLRSRSGKGPIK